IIASRTRDRQQPVTKPGSFREKIHEMSPCLRKLSPRKQDGAKIIQYSKLHPRSPLRGAKGREERRARLRKALVDRCSRPTQDRIRPFFQVTVGGRQTAPRDLDLLSAAQGVRQSHMLGQSPLNAINEPKRAVPRQGLYQSCHKSADAGQVFCEECSNFDVELL